MNQSGTNQSDVNPAHVNPDVPESVSAGVDGELSKEQLRFLLRRLDHDPSLQQSWACYHIARDSLRKQLPPLASAGFAARVMQAIEQESAPAAAMSRRSHWLRWSTGGVIAASVAAAALMIGQPTGDAERMTAATVQQTSPVIAAAPIGKPTAPAAVPPWLSGNSAGLLSQQASATRGALFGQNRSAYPGQLSAYPMHRYRTLDNNDGSYLLLLDPEQQPLSSSRQAAPIAQ